jgi:hypothetical protein
MRYFVFFVSYFVMFVKQIFITRNARKIKWTYELTFSFVLFQLLKVKVIKHLKGETVGLG